MTWELSQEFLFEANADDVVTYFMGSKDWQSNAMSVRELEVLDGQFILHVWLSVTPAIEALFSIGITGGTRAGAKFYDEKAYGLLSASTDLGEIGLRQRRRGECLGQLYLERNPRRLGSDHTSLWHVTPRLLGVLWNRFISDWLQRSNATAVKIPPGEVDSMAITVSNQDSNADVPSELLEPIFLNWRVSELRRWVEDFRDDNNLEISFFGPLADDSILINHEWAKGCLLSFKGQRLTDGRIRLIPKVDNTPDSIPAAVAELRRWREALSTATADMPVLQSSAAMERVSMAEIIVGLNESIVEASGIRKMTEQLTGQLTKPLTEGFQRAVGLDEESFERAREKLAHKKADGIRDQQNLAIEQLRQGQTASAIDMHNEQEPIGIRLPQRGMSEERDKRAHAFRRIKDANPHMSYTQVAHYANYNCSDETGIVTREDVRNDFRAKGWIWERADRIR